jgi:hypothetical protein
LKIKVEPDGTVTHIYTEKLDLSGIGKAQTRRASHVEPNDNNEWTADMVLSNNGPILGPFPTRSEALAAEVEWLEMNIL